MSPGAPLLKLEKVSKNYVAAEGAAPVAVLRDLSFDIAAGESVAVVGPSGSGKSTLLNIIGTLDQPTSGHVWLDGQDLSRLDELKLAAIRNRQIGFVFQSHHLLPQCSVLENVLVPTIADKKSKTRDGAPERAEKLLKRVGLGERLHHRPGQLSGGERQRVAVARALIRQPRLVLCDEPTGNLDQATAGSVASLLLDLHQSLDNILIVVTHSTAMAALFPIQFEIRDTRLHRVR